MNDEDKRRILWAIAGVDGGCPYCEGYILERLKKAFPDIGWPERFEYSYGVGPLEDWPDYPPSSVGSR